MSTDQIALDHAVLALDASGDGCSVALIYKQQYYYQESKEVRTHAQSLLPMIDTVLAEARIELKQLDYLALTHGPGSFTGIRIALSVVQGLAYASSLPILCVSSLDAIAIASPVPGKRIVAIDARMGEVYWTSYDNDDGAVLRTEDYHVSSVGDFNIQLERHAAQAGVVGLGNAWSLDGINTEVPIECYCDIAPNAKNILNYLQQVPNYDEIRQDASTIEPLYLRNEVAWKKRQRLRTS